MRWWPLGEVRSDLHLERRSTFVYRSLATFSPLGQTAPSSPRISEPINSLGTPPSHMAIGWKLSSRMCWERPFSQNVLRVRLWNWMGHIPNSRCLYLLKNQGSISYPQRHSVRPEGFGA